MSTTNEPTVQAGSAWDILAVLTLGITALAAFIGSALMFPFWLIASGFASHLEWGKFHIVLFPLLYGILATVAAIKYGRTPEGTPLALGCSFACFGFAVWMWPPFAIPGIILLSISLSATVKTFISESR